MFGFKSNAEKRKEAALEYVMNGRQLLTKIIPRLSENKYLDFYIFSWGYYEVMLDSFDIDNRTFQDIYAESMLHFSYNVSVNANKYIIAFKEFNGILKAGLENLSNEEEKMMQLGAQLCSFHDKSAFADLVTLINSRFS